MSAPSERSLAVTFFCAATLASQLARAQQPPAPPPPPVPPPPAAAQSAVDIVLPFCDSGDTSTRALCIQQIGAIGDPLGHARAKLAELAQRDPDNNRLAAATYARLYGTPAPLYQAGKSLAMFPNPNPTRHEFFPTAYTTPAGRTTWDTGDLGLWDFNHGLNDHLELGVATFPPLFVIAAMPHVKVSARLGEGVAGALHLDAGFFTPYVGGLQADHHAIILGGGGELSIGDPDRSFLNLGFDDYTAWASGGHGSLLLAHAGAAVRTSSSVSLNLEGLVPGLSDSTETIFAHAVVLIYGIRLMSRNLWGDLMFIAPICNGCGSLYRYALIGIPSIGFGYRFHE